MYWDSLTAVELDRVDRNTPVILPLASTEQHGPHLPIGTDRLIAEHFCRCLDKELSDRVLVLPTVAVTWSAHHMDFTGTLTVSHHHLDNYVEDILDSVVSHGFKNLIVFNAHGGNVGIATVLAERFGNAHRDHRIVLVTWWTLIKKELQEISDSGPGGVGHACELETSILLAADPLLVRQEAITPPGQKATFAWAESDMLRFGVATLVRSTKQMSENGVCGNPTTASAAKGRQITDAVVARLTQIIDDLLFTPNGQ